MPTLPKTPLVSDHVFGALLEAVLSGRYAAGEKLPTQRVLAADLGVTLSSLREALKRLEQMGLIDLRHGDATRVRDWRAHGGLDVVAHLLFGAGGLDTGVLGDVLESRSLMLREIAGLAAQRRSEEQAARLTELAECFASKHEPIEAALVDFAFFTAVAEAAGNVVFILILNSIRDLYFDHLAAVPVTADPQALAPLYTQLAEAIAAKDAAHARQLAQTLAQLQRERVDAAVAQLTGTEPA